jgi:phage shock protein PspC (stress-responsive transcriptional regulator)
MIGGVCAGLAQRYGMKPNTVRLLAVLSCLLPGPQFVAYLIMWAIIPSE